MNLVRVKNSFKSNPIVPALLALMMTACGAAESDAIVSQSAEPVVATKAFRHTANAGNTFGAFTLLDQTEYPELGDPETMVLASSVYFVNPLSGPSPIADSPVAVEYSKIHGGWGILNVTGAGHVAGSIFSVVIPGNQGEKIVKTVGSTSTLEGIVGSTRDTDPNAKIFVTPVYEEAITPIGNNGLSVRYDFVLGHPTEVWSLRKESGALFSVGERFNIYVAPGSENAQTSIATAASPFINIFSSMDNDVEMDGVHIVTMNTTGAAGLINKNICLGQIASSFIQARHIDGSNIAVGRTFNILTIF